MKKTALHHMTWKEVEKSFKEDPVLIIPLGSMEEHGPHSITGDFLAATEIAKRIAEKTKSLYTPTVPFGNSEYFRSYPGTISLSQNTVVMILEDMCTSLVEHGVRRIIFLNGHAGNKSALDTVARKMRREFNITITAVNLWQMLSKEHKENIYKDDNDPSGHGGEPLTSVMSYLHPEDMRMDLLPDNWQVKEKYHSFSLDNLNEINVKDSKANIYLNMEDISTEGILGNPQNASAERGRKIVEVITDYGIELVKQMEEM